FSSRRRHTRFSRDWSSDVCSSDLALVLLIVTASLLVGFLNKFSWGSYTALFLAWMFTVPGPVDEGTLQWLLVLMAAVWLARKVQIGRASCRDRASVAVGVVNCVTE